MRYIAVLLLAGCASNQLLWEKPGASVQEFEMDRGQCQAQAFSAPGMYAMQVALIYNACMRGKGWYQVEYSAAKSEPIARRPDYKECNDSAEKDSGTRNIFDSSFKDAYATCMRARGRSETE